MATPLLPPPSRQQEIAHKRYFRKSIKRRRIVFLAFQLFKSLSTKGAFRKRVAGICFLKVKNNLCLCREDLRWIPAIDHPSKTLTANFMALPLQILTLISDVSASVFHFPDEMKRGGWTRSNANQPIPSLQTTSAYAEVTPTHDAHVIFCIGTAFNQYKCWGVFLLCKNPLEAERDQDQTPLREGGVESGRVPANSNFFQAGCPQGSSSKYSSLKRLLPSSWN